MLRMMTHFMGAGCQMTGGLLLMIRGMVSLPHPLQPLQPLRLQPLLFLLLCQYLYMYRRAETGAAVAVPCPSGTVAGTVCAGMCSLPPHAQRSSISGITTDAANRKQPTPQAAEIDR